MNILDGNNGLQSHSRLNAQILQLQQKIVDIKSENNLLNTKISLLQPNQVNEDLIDESVRRVFGYGKKNEYTIYFN
jgi:cell division protein FtsB